MYFRRVVYLCYEQSRRKKVRSIWLSFLIVGLATTGKCICFKSQKRLWIIFTRFRESRQGQTHFDFQFKISRLVIIAQVFSSALSKENLSADYSQIQVLLLTQTHHRSSFYAQIQEIKSVSQELMLSQRPDSTVNKRLTSYHQKF